MRNVGDAGLGFGHTCLVKIDGSLWCWGYNVRDQLGDGIASSRFNPMRVLSGISSSGNAPLIRIPQEYLSHREYEPDYHQGTGCCSTGEVSYLFFVFILMLLRKRNVKFRGITKRSDLLS